MREVMGVDKSKRKGKKGDVKGILHPEGLRREGFGSKRSLSKGNHY